MPDVQYLCLDVANGYSQFFVDCVAAFRDEFPKKTIIAGNVVTGEMVEELILTGADIIKVGIGPGNFCTRVSLSTPTNDTKFSLQRLCLYD